MASLAQEIFLLMLHLSRMRDRDLMCRLFVDALAAANPGTHLRLLAQGEESVGEVIEIATASESFGRIAVESMGAMSPEDGALCRNAIAMLAVVLENASRTAQLRDANSELEAFAHTVSHDLRAPVRHIDAFAGLLRRRIGASLDDQSKHYLDSIDGATARMDRLIDDLLSFSRMGRRDMFRRVVALVDLVNDIIRELEPEAQGRDVQWRVGELPTVSGDPAMLRVAFSNLLANALKFTRPRPETIIEIGCRAGDEPEHIIFVRDNGVGFDMAHSGKLFGVFQRLHGEAEFEGTGIGLATVRRIVARHLGRTWAESQPGAGATFFMAFPRVLF